ncbi:MAG: pyridoxamine 5'-phosphate oxidase family protein [Deltaproteobacteria bacterium]|jgi:nitroimidazol reductase NimA-like FMN-containing flavoprotein (pyridoxamine 5'-phosphate oxidase superfamily)|nr:pyridoxamine 5'-phosphate oxidase family protein [Deltaproteobacteria bacterium]
MTKPSYPDVRRKDRQISEHEAWEVLKNGQYGVLSTVGEDGLPYGVPLSYVVRDGKLYFHCAVEGRKLRNIKANSQITFTVVAEHRPVLQKGHFSATFKSAMVLGNAVLLTDPAARRKAFFDLIEGLVPEHLDKAAAYIEQLENITAAVEIIPELVTGKARPDQFD